MRLTLLFIAAAFRCSLSDVLIGDVVIEEHSEAKNWRNASRVCKENSGHLVRDCPEFHDQLPTGIRAFDKRSFYFHQKIFGDSYFFSSTTRYCYHPIESYETMTRIGLLHVDATNANFRP